ncbi:MAG: hypothetical protein FJ206_15750 [Gemmatimonadetes bacterium]|nr:hypothetical protein [Gemmatimonadota bacterium]
MTGGLRAIVVAHGGLSSALVRAAEEVSGIRGAMTPVSNAGCDRDALERRILEAIGSAAAVVFVDMPSGSCLFAAMRQLKDRSDVAVVTGVNLPMLLDFLFNRDQSARDAAKRAAEVGARSVGVR